MLSLACVNMPFAGALGAYGSGAYTCTASICVGKYADVATVFRRLQSLTNQAAAGLGIGAPIAVDGKIGPSTVARLFLVSSSMPPRPDLPLLTNMQGSMSPSALAATSADFVAELEALISGEMQFPSENVPTGPVRPSTGVPGLPSVPVHMTPRPTQTPGVPGAGPHITESGTPAFITAMPPAARLGLALAAVGVLGAVLYKVRKSRRASAPTTVAGLFGFGRRRRR